MDDEPTFGSSQVWPSDAYTVTAPVPTVDTFDEPAVGEADDGPAAAEPERAARPRRWPKRVAVAAMVLIVLGAVGGMAAWGFDQRDTAKEWKARSELFEGKLEAAEAEIEQTVAERDAAASKVAGLEAQLSAVANEKAKLGNERESLRQLFSLVPTINSAMQSCAAAQGEIAAEALDVAANMPDASFDRLDGLIDDAGDICTEANTLASTLQEVVDGLAP